MILGSTPPGGVELGGIRGESETPPPPPPAPGVEFVQKVYDALNRPIKVTTSLASLGSGVPPSTVRQLIDYTSTGLKWRVTDELDRQSETHYDGLGRAIKTISPEVDNGHGIPDHARTSTEYDGNNNVTQKTNPLGKVWQFQYDTRNRKTVELQPGPDGSPPGPTIYHTYDPVGNAIALKDANGNTTDTSYDQNNRPTTVEGPAVTAPDGTSQRPLTVTGYDKNGNVVSVTDANGHETVNEYDALNRLTSTTDAEEIEVTCTYDLTDNRITVTDGLSQTTNFAYDGLKRLTTTTDPAGKVTTLGYDAINKTSRTDPLGQVTLYAYDLRNHLLSTVYTGRSADNRTYAYDWVGNLQSVSEAGHGGAANVAYTYDALNRVLTETSGGLTHEYKYDLANNRIYVKFGGTERILNSIYDQLNRLTSLTEDGRETTYGYDDNGNVLTKLLPNDETITTEYDALNRRVTITAPQYTYTQLYDLVGNLVQIQESYPSNPGLDRAVSNIYDNINRLKNETFSTLPLVLDGGTGVPPYYPAAGTITEVTTYTYDHAHNRAQRVQAGVTTTYTYDDNPLNQLSQWADGTNTVTYTYDLNGNRLTRTQGGVTDTYGYDYENRLLGVNEAGASYVYTYDYRTRRVKRVEAGTATKIVFSGGTSIAEYDAGSALQVEYVRGSDWGGGVGGLLYSIRATAPSYTHCNSRGDVTAKTDGTGAVTWQAEYEAFGTHPNEVGATLDRHKANTKEEDPTGLLNEGFRYRDLETGTFITRDPIGFVDGPNLYTYVRQNPWTHFDPKGLAGDVGPDGRFHPEAKLYRVKYNPANPAVPSIEPVKSAKDIEAKNATIFINGMANVKLDAAQLGLQHTGKKSFYLLANPSEGGYKDFVKEAIPERLGAHLTVDRTTKDLLKKFDLTTASVFAHSQGAMIANHAIEDLTHEGVRTAGMKLYYDGSAANIFATRHIANAAGATLERFDGHPLDAVHNIVGLNTINPLRIVGSLLAAPLLFGPRDWSPHGEHGGGSHLKIFQQFPFLK